MKTMWTRKAAMKAARLLAKYTGEKHVVLKQGWRYFACECNQAKLLVTLAGAILVR